MAASRLAVVAAAVGASLLHVPTAHAVTFDCNANTPSHENRVGADGATTVTNTNVDGVAGQLYVPSFTNYNLHDDLITAADIAFVIEDSVGHFFQVGWYVGQSTTGLPYAGTPRVFVGEGTFYPYPQEVTTASVSLTTSTVHHFRLFRDGNPTSPTYLHYKATVDGVNVWTSTMAAAMEGTPRVLGETNWDCADMYLWAATAANGPTLQGRHAGGTWSLWQQHIQGRNGTAFDDPRCWASGRVNGYTATAYAYDVC